MSTPLERRFAGRTLVVATMHGKERVIGPALAERLPLAGWRVVQGLDTDRFGTFSGEVRRERSPRDSAEAKARAALELGHDLVVASEGSFGPHPVVPFVSCDEEWLVLVDAVHGAVHEQRLLALETAHAGRACASLEELAAFVEGAPFPAHALVLRPREVLASGDELHKGITDRAELERRARELLHRHGGLWVEVDLRAHHNPTRMAVIERTARALAAELATPCPRCAEPWFRVVEHVPGLPCSDCGTPTESTRALRRACASCAHSTLEPRADGRTREAPMHCPECNP